MARLDSTAELSHLSSDQQGYCEGEQTGVAWSHIYRREESYVGKIAIDMTVAKRGRLK